MARGAEVVAPLPKVSFVKIDDDRFSKPAGVADNTARGFGCERISFMFSASIGQSHAPPPQIMMVRNSRGLNITSDIVVNRSFVLVP
jgi:hypothetical protein